GINLEEANLSDSSFIGTNLNRASLRGSDLEHANLQQAKLDGANLSNTRLTGACLEDWTIDETTILSKVICDYIFLEELPDRMAGRRRFPPSPNNFRYGD
ncbi:MAG: pentapeptide repeat-containing protein, partial [Nostoc sp.]